MKVIIIEGPDNTGKNTLIQSVIDNNDVVKYIHCDRPTSSDPFMENKRLFFNHAKGIVRDISCDDCDVTVFNRYYQGEYVYGQLYRHLDGTMIKQMISELEDFLLNNVGREYIYYVQLSSTSTELLIQNDDGNSLSAARQDNIERELELFNEVFQFSRLKKRQIFINDGNSFRNRSDILSEFNQFINNE